MGRGCELPNGSTQQFATPPTTLHTFPVRSRAGLAQRIRGKGDNQTEALITALWMAEHIALTTNSHYPLDIPTPISQPLSSPDGRCAPVVAETRKSVVSNRSKTCICTRQRLYMINLISYPGILCVAACCNNVI